MKAGLEQALAVLGSMQEPMVRSLQHPAKHLKRAQHGYDAEGFRATVANLEQVTNSYFQIS
jgi:hypothetical protein